MTQRAPPLDGRAGHAALGWHILVETGWPGLAYPDQPGIWGNAASRLRNERVTLRYENLTQRALPRFHDETQLTIAGRNSISAAD
jgi:hypothetical protein